VVATLEDLDEGALMEILTKPKNALVKQYGRLFEMEGVKLSFTDDALRSVATRAIARRTGARGLRSIMEAILLATMFDLPGLDGVEEVVINREVAESRANPLYLYGKERAESSALAPGRALLAKTRLKISRPCAASSGGRYAIATGGVTARRLPCRRIAKSRADWAQTVHKEVNHG